MRWGHKADDAFRAHHGPYDGEVGHRGFHHVPAEDRLASDGHEGSSRWDWHGDWNGDWNRAWHNDWHEPKAPDSKAPDPEDATDQLSSAEASVEATAEARLSSVATGGNEAGNGGDGTFVGSMSDNDIAIYIPINIALASYGGAATATQYNLAVFDQGATQVAGMGGAGGSGNVAGGGSVGSLAGALTGSAHGSLLHFLSVTTGGNEAGNGGDGTFIGSLFDDDIAIYAPINIAIAGYGGTATATQYNEALFNQGAIQIAGNGGDGGSGNDARGGDVTSAADTTFSDAHDGSALSTGGNEAGNGGDGTFIGAMSDNDVAVYMPINIAIAGFGGRAMAIQENAAVFDQGATQVAGNGGDGGDRNIAQGGDVATLEDRAAAQDSGDIASLLHADTVDTGGNAAGNGGDGTFIGTMSDDDIALYLPIDLALSDVDTTALQERLASFGPETSPVAGLGEGDLAHGSDLFALFSDFLHTA